MPGQLIGHSDAGSQYTSIRFTEHLELEGIRPSIGTVGDAYDNALMETRHRAVQDRVHPHHRLPDRPVTRPSPTSSTPPPAGSTGTTTAGCTVASAYLTPIEYEASPLRDPQPRAATRMRAAENLGRFKLRIRAAGFPARKTLEDFEWDAQPTARPQIAGLASGGVPGRSPNVVLLGPPGTGKTHLATGLGVTAARHGHRVLFATATDWVTRLSEAHRAGRLAARAGPGCAATG